jgi:2'-5' RNA ligase
MSTKRIQLTLFVGENESEPIEQIRREFDPIQHAIIGAHVTLCREDELEQIEKVMRNIEALNAAPLSIEFGKVIRFSEGKGVLMPAVGENEGFQQLRQAILRGIIEAPRKHEPHITLMHPRNVSCTDDMFKHIETCVLPTRITFSKISFIEQEMGKKWHILHTFALKSRP